MKREKRKSLPVEMRRFIEFELERINQYKSDLSHYKLNMIPSATPSYSGMTGGGSGEARPIENLTIKLATDDYIYNLEKTIRAYDNVINRLSRTDKKLIDLIYWKKSHTKEGAAIVCNMSKTATYDRINAILIMIAKERGFIPFDY